MEHGEKRGEKVTQITGGEPAEWKTTSGKVLKIAASTLTETGYERWCETCQEWVLSLGIIDNLLCRQCHTAW